MSETLLSVSTSQLCQLCHELKLQTKSRPHPLSFFCIFFSPAVQDVEALEAIEGRFEELQLQARRSDSVRPALVDMTQYLRSRAEHSAAHTAIKSVEVAAIPQLTQLWCEISTLASAHFRLSCDVATQTSGRVCFDMIGSLLTNSRIF
jgi:hypothetical protein